VGVSLVEEELVEEGLVPASALLPLAPPGPPKMYLPAIWIKSTAGVVNAISSPGFKVSTSPPGYRPT